MIAVREFTGSMALRGVYVLEGGDDVFPTLAFVDEFDGIEQEAALLNMEPGALSWRDVITKMVVDQDMLIIRREGPFETPLNAAELLAKSLAAIAAGVPPHALPMA